ncbi:MAG TPA: hypothetical protein VIY90_14660 [Steroidobacteraceae bacterium]
MHAVVLLTILCASFADYAVALGAPAPLKFLPEACSGVVAIYVLLEGMHKGFAGIAPKYWVVFGVLSFLIVCGILTNGVGSGPILSGARFYTRAMPLFLLPAIAQFSDKQLTQQLKLMLGVALLQVPIASYQRWIIWSAGRFSGDDVRGTLMDSGVLSIFLICCVLVLTGLFMKKQIGRTKFLLLFFVLLLPTTINETKATVILLPVGLFTAIVAAAPRGKRLRITGWTVALLVVFGSILVPVYDLMNANSPYKKERNIQDFFTNQQQMQRYLEAKKGTAQIGTLKPVRRGDAISIPLQYLSQDPLRLAFGLGLGNASSSSLGQNFVGDYYGLFRSFLIMSFSVFLLEIGVLGTVLVFVLYWLVGRDCLTVARKDGGILGGVASGWIGVVAVMVMATFYTTTHMYSSLSYFYWYFSGVVIARATQLAWVREAKVAPAKPLAQSTPASVAGAGRAGARISRGAGSRGN